MVKAIETRYKGYRMRSRLEARWGVFFDAVGIKWEYEKQGYDLGKAGRYLPDFWLSCPTSADLNAGYWLEIKGAEPTNDELDKVVALAEFTKRISMLVHGLPGQNLLYYARHDGCHGFCMSDQVDDQVWFSLFCLVSLFSYRTGSLDMGIEAARSARFEYGECNG